MISRRLRLPRTRIEYLLKKGIRIVNDCFAVRFLPSNRQKSAENRFCVVISANLEPLAVKRNRLRRRIYEIIRLNTARIAEGRDIIVIGKKPLAKLDYHGISVSLLNLLKKIR